MSRKQFVRYWVFTAEGDPIPAIGSGFRTVLAEVGTKWVRIKGATDNQSVRIPLKVWENIPHRIHEEEAQLCHILTDLRKYRPPKPCDKKECNG